MYHSLSSIIKSTRNENTKEEEEEQLT